MDSTRVGVLKLVQVQCYMQRLLRDCVAGRPRPPSPISVSCNFQNGTTKNNNKREMMKCRHICSEMFIW